jgi:serine/threonine protein kinase/Tol biopolymer transport system component
VHATGALLESGTRLGTFEITSVLGVGGMGEVYLARDSQLGRSVAVKVLPSAVAADPHRLARFENEARLLASLNNPRIATIHGLERSGEVRFLVLEFVPGETLKEKLERGPLPVPEALRVCCQVAEALEAAHARGIIHRDLKGANIKVTSSGAVKVLDFGLAKALTGDLNGDPDSPTNADGLTAEGLIVGTAAYMSPEQARGQSIDTRTDIWSFGCVLYETLTGKPVFTGETPSDKLAAVLSAEPDWTALPRATPAGVRNVLRRCLARDRGQRLHHITDARLEIEQALAEPRDRLRPLRWALPVLLLVLALASAAIVRRPASPRASRIPLPRLHLNAPPGVEPFDGLTWALSPDGTRIVVASGDGSARRLYDRPLRSLEAAPIRGTEGGASPFFSPDGQWIGFHVEGRLKKVPIQGGEPVDLCAAPSPRGAAWGSDGTIVFAPSGRGGLWRVPAAGGTPKPLTDSPAGEVHRWPTFLPGGKAVVFTVLSANNREDERVIAVLSLATGERRVLLKGGTYPRYAASGQLLFGRSGALHAVPFDLDTLNVTGPSVPVLDDLLMWYKTSGQAYVDVSADGTLVYVPGGFPHRTTRQLVLVDLQGRVTELPAPSRPYSDVMFSPDGERLAVTVEGPKDDIFVFDLQRRTLTRLPLEGDSRFPAWSPDGKSIAFSSVLNGPRSLFRVPADGSRPPEQISQSRDWQTWASYSPDGTELLFTEVNAETGPDLWVLRFGGGQRRPLVATPAVEMHPTLSPDGRFLSYTSNESGREEVYVRPYPGLGRKWVISSGGGSFPCWARSGREMFYVSGDNKMMMVPVRTEGELTPGTPRPLFTMPADGGYTVSPDGRGFAMIKRSPKESAPPQIVVVPGWFEELTAKVR